MRRTVLLLAVALVVAACGPRGSGTVVTVERSVGEFDRVAVSEGLDLEVELGSDYSVSVTYDDNLTHLIGTEVVAGELQIEVIDSFRAAGGRRFVSVTAPSLTTVAATSGADVRVTGTTDRVTIDASNGAAFDLSLLDAVIVEVKASSGAFVAVRATGLVTGSASAGAEIIVFGDAEIDVTTDGGATVSRGD